MVLLGKFIALNACIKKMKEVSHINDLSFHLKKLEKGQNKNKACVKGRK